MELDAEEGADILMVKPAITSLDLLALTRQRLDHPLAPYQVSGEAAMIEAASRIVMTYFAADVATWLKEDL
jgi:porphobilinogen synthase